MIDRTAHARVVPTRPTRDAMALARQLRQHEWAAHASIAVVPTRTRRDGSLHVHQSADGSVSVQLPDYCGRGVALALAGELQLMGHAVALSADATTVTVQLGAGVQL